MKYLRILHSQRNNILLRLTRHNSHCVVQNSPNAELIGSFFKCSSKEVKDIAKNGLTLIPNFINEEEEKNLLKEINPKWRRLKYQESHWDNAIHQYRETQISNWLPDNEKVIKRIHQIAFKATDHIKNGVHILDLSEEGFIKPHVDSIKFCGRCIAGVSLLSPSVMRLVNEKNNSQYIDVLLHRRSLYVIKNRLRFDFTHEILRDKDSYFDGKRIEKKRRISVICRSESLEPSSISLFQNNAILFDDYNK